VGEKILMYDNNNPTDGQNSSTRGNLANSSKSNPCPVCGRTKDGDCRISQDGKMVLCHQNFDHAKTQQPDLWHFDKSSSDGRCGIYIFKEDSENIQPATKKPRAKKKELLPVPIPSGAKLLRLPAPGQSPQPEKLAKDAPKRIRRDAVQITYEYSPTQGVVRYEWPDATNPKGRDKTFSQFHIDSDGKKDWTKGDAPWSAYRIDEVVEVLKTVPDDEPIVILMPEGENNVEIARRIRLASVTLQGSNWSDREIQKMLETLRATGKNVILGVLHDNDDTGNKKGKGVWLVARHVQFPCLVIDPTAMWADIPEKGDIREFLEAMEADEFLIRVEAEIFKAANSTESNDSLTSHPRTCECVVCLSSKSSIDNYIPDTAPTPEQNYVQKALEALYSGGHWASIAGQLFEFTGTHYELRPEATEKRRIFDWLSTYSEFVNGKYRCNRANSASVNEVYNSMILAAAVDPNTINPEGLNSSSGVVKINPDGSHTLVPHNPKQVYTYVGCKYDPNIDPTDCDRLLECLEPSQREIFLRTAAAALNLKLVRSKLTGRGVKGLLCHGEGSNGKDTLRAVLAAVFGRGMTGKSLSDFKSYDMGRKFNLAGIEGSICNWASENTANVDLDNIQSLKQFITGDPLDIERKGKDSYEYKSAAIFFANCNKLPSITGGTAAIDDRYGILRFDKTYTRNAIAAEGQLEADPRFKDDEKFIFEQVAPAMLNKLLERLPLLLSEGIDYKATKDAMQKAQEESRHLWQFVRDIGVEAQTCGRIYIKDLWELLQKWYLETGTLEIEEGSRGKDKLIWHDLPNKFDTPVKATNQVFARFSEIFPKLQKLRYMERAEIERKGQWYLSGIGFSKTIEQSANIASPASPVDLERVTASPLAFLKNAGEATGEARILSQKAGEAGEAISSPFSEICNLLSRLNQSERQKLIELLTQPQPEEFAEQIKKAIANFDRSLAIQVWDGLKAKAKRKLREEVKTHLTARESDNFKILVMVGFLLDMRVKYVGDPKYAEQYEGLELKVHSMNEYAQINCRKPDGYLTTWLKPEDLEKL
jgi:putative DNA primase/helicase